MRKIDWMAGPLTLALAAVAACGEPADTGATAGSEDTTAVPAGASDAATADGEVFLDPNAASREQLASVPGLDAELIDTLVAGRPYGSMLGVDSVLAARLDEAQRDTVYTRVWMPIDLNTASAEEILLIPGVGPRMRHEFEEYRPYRGMQQFRREIGKYVDEAEVARLERYVEIR